MKTLLVCCVLVCFEQTIQMGVVCIFYCKAAEFLGPTPAASLNESSCDTLVAAKNRYL